MDNPKFVLFKGEDGQFYFHLQAVNGEIVSQSEGYTEKASAKNGIEAIKRDAPAAPIDDRS
jgi:uncharacterized protein YegP (UPF0339 family)